MIHKVLAAAAIVTVLSGCSGATGAQGEEGMPGDPGVAGPAGPAGTAGPSGTAGPTGPAGAPGATGPAGATGATGPAGTTGTTAPTALYILSNDANSNDIIAYARSATTGALSPFGEFPTGGAGTGSGLASQGALIFDASQNHFFAVNAGDSSISELGLNPDGSISLLSNVPSGGTAPISLTLYNSTLYVLNSGSATVAANITGFTVDPAGLIPIAGSPQVLSAAQPGAEQISFVQSGSVLVVTEKGADNIDTFTVANGVASEGTFTSAGAAMAPYGFGIYNDNLLVVSQATANTGASSYSISAAGEVTIDTALVADGELAACWVTIVGTTAYALNAHNATISAYTITPATGDIALVGASGTPSATTGAGPTDIAASPDGAFLYTRNGAGESITSWPIAASGTLGATTTFAGTPASSVGLVVR